jgi:hypothetical protein
MRRTVLLLLAATAVAICLSGGVALAYGERGPGVTKTCQRDCDGTTYPDTLIGTNAPNHIEGLVHIQDRLCVMGYNKFHETTNLCPPAFKGREGATGGRPALQRRLRPASLPDSVSERSRRTTAADSSLFGLCFP